MLERQQENEETMMLETKKAEINKTTVTTPNNVTE